MSEQMGRFKHQSMQDPQSIIRYLAALKKRTKQQQRVGKQMGG